MPLTFRLRNQLKKLLLLSLLSASLVSAQKIAITDVTVINPRNGSVQPHRTVIVEDGRIRSVEGPIIESRANVERMKREGTVEPVDRIRVGIANPEEARTVVRRLASQGVDHIKIRSTPDLETFHALGG